METEIRKRGMSLDVNVGLELDRRRRNLLVKIETLRARKNEASKIIAGARGEEREKLVSEMRKLNQNLKKWEDELRGVEEKLFSYLSYYPNISHPSVPVGSDETANVVLRYHGEKPEFDFEPKTHIELGVALDILDEVRAAKVSGSRFVFLKNEAVLLEFALVQYVLNILMKKGFVPMIPPVLVKERAMFGTGFLPVEETQYYKTSLDDLYLVGTSEVPLCAYHSDEFLDAGELPKKYAGFSTCFRREAGSYGRDLGGMFRVHQFDKVEMFVYAHPSNSWEEFEKLRENLEEIMKGLGLHYRIVDICTGELGTPNARKYDLEAWLPGQQNYRELASCSHDTDFQARRLNIKYKDENGKKGFVHTMNSTACAIGRTLIAIFENYQDIYGNIRVPEALLPYMGGIEMIIRK